MQSKVFILIAVTVAAVHGVARADAIVAEISLRGNVQLEKSVVRLGDVADVVAADSRRVQQLTALVLMPAPAPGTERFLSRHEVQDLLAAHGEDMQQMRFTGAERVALTAPAAVTPVAQAGDQDISREASRRAGLSANHSMRKASPPLNSEQAKQLHSEIERVISAHLGAQSGQSGAWRVTCEIAERYTRQLQAATSPLVCTGGAAPWIGEQRFVVSFTTAECEASVPIYAVVTRPEPIVVANRAIERGQTITAADVELAYRDEALAATGRRAAAIKTIEELIGLEAARSIQAGEVIYSDEVQAPLLVKRGEEITVTSQAGGIRVRTTARARQDGARGELIEVETLETKERFDARVVGHGEAAVFSSAGTQVARRPAPTGGARR